jgi:peptidoglycan/LPS O-acetylase OafA/YrhL
VLFHLGVNAFSNGYLGVDVFFIISGYLMMSLYGRASSADSWLSYYFKRVRRIYPAYVFVLFVVVVLSARIVLPFEYESVFGSSFPDVFLLGNIYSWGQSAYFARNLFRPTLHLWSLGVECQFYAIFPIMIILSRRSNTYLFAIAFASLAIYILAATLSPKTAFFLIPCRIWQFCLGFLAAKMTLRAPRGVFTASTILLLIVIAMSPRLSIGPTPTTLIASIVTGIACWSSREFDAKSAVLIPIYLLGKYSYSVYLTHFPIITLLAYHPFEGGMLDLQWPYGYLLAILVTVVSSILLFHLIENPARRRITFPATATIAVLVGTGVISASAVCAPLLLQSHIPGRQGLAASAWQDRLTERCPMLGRILRPWELSCVISGGGSHVVLLVGDSHADVLKRILGQEVERRGGPFAF